MIKLTRQQEADVIKYIINNEPEYIANGAARWLCEANNDILEGIIGCKDLDRTYIIKIAMGNGGVRQLEAETAAYERFGKTYALAQIIAAGQFVEVMESVDPLTYELRDYNEFDDGEEFFDEVLSYGYNEDNEDEVAEYEDYKDKILKAFDVAVSLEDIFGSTGDNGQVGINELGEIVAYDYGFEADTSCDEQTSSLCDVFEGGYSDMFVKYLHFIHNMIVNDCYDTDDMNDFENSLTHEYYDYDRYYEEDEEDEEETTMDSRIIDFEQKGNMVKFYLGDINENYWGDDWDDQPWDDNAGPVYKEFVKDTMVVAANFNDKVLVPIYCSKRDMKLRRIPCVIIIPAAAVGDRDWDNDFDYWLGHADAIRIYFGDNIYHVLANNDNLINLGK